HPEPADLVLAPAIASESMALPIARSARRALAAGGRLVLALPGEAAAAPRALARAIGRALRAEGFRRIRLRAIAGRDGAALLLLGLALVGAGLVCVWLEIGRPLRALHVFVTPRTSWMSREAFTASPASWPGSTSA
ncbi:MAG: hypothetical protein ACLGHR_14000, partial [Gammaproteobacteria bacterium]